MTEFDFSETSQKAAFGSIVDKALDPKFPGNLNSEYQTALFTNWGNPTWKYNSWNASPTRTLERDTDYELKDGTKVHSRHNLIVDPDNDALPAVLGIAHGYEKDPNGKVVALRSEQDLSNALDNASSKKMMVKKDVTTFFEDGAILSQTFSKSASSAMPTEFKHEDRTHMFPGGASWHMEVRDGNTRQTRSSGLEFDVKTLNKEKDVTQTAISFPNALGGKDKIVELNTPICFYSQPNELGAKYEYARQVREVSRTSLGKPEVRKIINVNAIVSPLPECQK